MRPADHSEWAISSILHGRFTAGLERLSGREMVIPPFLFFTDLHGWP
jgi:hypothetical protein